METKVPKHHVKEEVCATRPTYREGRVPKAVKVYTVNNESQYILIQNVPSVGAKEELLKLCSSFGPLEDHHILDEYPSEDKFTEVYLIKYKNINSARFAKRKLDDHSFFGGNLHVCYAPEYENIEETRAKLQERRRTVARKIRQHYGAPFKEFHQASTKKHFHTQVPPQSQSSAGPSNPTHTSNASAADISHDNVSQPGDFIAMTQTTVPNSAPSVFNPVSLESLQKSERIQESLIPPPDTSSSEGHFPPVTFDIPLPPKPNPRSHNVRKNMKYEFAKVRSHHATLPSNFISPNDELIPSMNRKTDPKLPPTGNAPLTGRSEIASNFRSTGNKERSPLIIRDYKISKPTLKFVPRQAMKQNSDETGHNQQDLQNLAIKKSAFLLGDVQGPSDIPDRRREKPKLKRRVEDSYQSTISAIRNKISKAISDTVKPQ